MFVDEGYSESGRFWNASVGAYAVTSDALFAVVAVPNGTYNVSVVGPFCGPEGLPDSVVVNGTGARITFQTQCYTPWPLPPPPLPSSPSPNPLLPLADLLIVVSGVFAGTVLTLAKDSGRRRV